MKIPNIISLTGAFMLMLVSTSAGAGTLSGATTTLNGVNAVVSPPKITAPGQVIQLKHLFGVAYYGPDKSSSFTCWAKLEYSDGGVPPEMVPVKFPMDAVGRMRQYTKAQKYTATLTGTPHNGQPACLGSATATFTIAENLPPPAAKKGPTLGASNVTPQGLQAIQGMAPIKSTSKLAQVTLRGGNVYPPGNVWLYSTISLNKPLSDPGAQCKINFSVMTTHEGADAFSVALLSITNYSPFANSGSTDFNPGNLNFPQPGKFRVVVNAIPSPDSFCYGSVTSDFEVKRLKMDFTPPPPPPVLPPSTLTNITVNDQPNGFAVAVHGTGKNSCTYMLRAVTTPFNDRVLNEVMVYEKDTIKVNKGYALIPKPPFGYTVNVEVIYGPEYDTGLKNCVGAPTLEIKLPGAPSAPGMPKKGKITGLTIAKSTYAVGDSITAMLQAEGDACHFNWRVRKLPFINLSDDIVFDGKTDPLSLNDWNLNNLGHPPLPPGNWTAFAQPLPSWVPANGIICGIPPAGKGQVFFTVTP